jgi:hypothetical protein
VLHCDFVVQTLRYLSGGTLWSCADSAYARAAVVLGSTGVAMESFARYAARTLVAAMQRMLLLMFTFARGSHLSFWFRNLQV